MARLSEKEGIGKAYSAKLEVAGIGTLEDLLKVCCEKIRN